MRQLRLRRSLTAALCFLLLLSLQAVARQTGQPPVLDTSATARLKDVTDSLALRPGLVVAFPITQGIDTHWKQIGNYEFRAQIQKCDLEGLTFDWTMSYPADASGSRNVTAEDMKESSRVSLFYPKRESCTMSGFTNAVRISDSLFQALQEGRRTGFELDGPEVPAGHTRDPRFSPRSIQAVGREYAPVLINGKRAKVRAIKARTDNGWTYWVMDNAEFPLMVAGSGPFGWAEPRFDTALLDAGQAGEQIIKQLEEAGIATTHAILFDFNKATIKPRSKPILDELAGYLKRNPKINLETQGHTDSVGSLEYNMKLSLNRAAAVKQYLVEHGIERSRLTTQGFGYTRPMASNATEAGRAQNRRVVFRKL